MSKSYVPSHTTTSTTTSSTSVMKAGRFARVLAIGTLTTASILASVPTHNVVNGALDGRMVAQGGLLSEVKWLHSQQRRREVSGQNSRGNPLLPTPTPLPPPPSSSPWHVTSASWYDLTPKGCYDGRGFHPHPRGLKIWTAHKTLPCGTELIIRYGTRSIRARVRDRGPYVTGRDLDLSAGAFRALSHLSRGVLRVRWRRA